MALLEVGACQLDDQLPMAPQILEIGAQRQWLADVEEAPVVCGRRG